MNTIKVDRAIIYSFITLNSISGLEISGISVNSLLVGAFAIYIYCRSFKGKINIRVKGKEYFLWFLCACIMSCAFSMLYSFTIPHVRMVRSYLINSLIYVFVYIRMTRMRSASRDEINRHYINGLVCAARIQAVWGLLQLIMLYGAGININEILFVDILKSSNKGYWIMGFYTGSLWNLRITGLNYENSMFALVTCIGVALEKNKVWKLFLTTIAILSLSRTAWVMIIAYYIFKFYRFLKNNKHKIKKKDAIIIITLLIIMILTVRHSFATQNIISQQIINIKNRLYDVNSINISARKHLLYYPYGFLIWLTRTNPLMMLFGYGMRCSGVAFSNNLDICGIVGIGNNSEAWAVECDVIGILLGGGIIALVLYYLALFSMNKSVFNEACFIILIGGLVYHFHSISYIIITIILAQIDSCRTSKRV